MKYAELREHFIAYQQGKISRAEVACAIGLWQRGGSRTDCPIINTQWPSIMRKAGCMSC